MIVDASAIVAMISREPDAEGLMDRLRSAVSATTHPVSVFEAAMALSRLNRIALETGLADVMEFLSQADMRVEALDASHGAAAVAAHACYGKGRHPARLNMGDCFSYAVAKGRGLPLLYKGEDFAQTDLA